MNLLPYEKYTIEPGISREEAISVLSNSLKNIDLLDELSLELRSVVRDNAYKGAVTPDGFRIRRLNGIGYPYLIADGKFQEDGTKFKIDVLLALPAWMNVLYIFYLCGGIYFFIKQCVSSGGVKITLSFFILGGMIIYSIIMYHYNLEAENARVFLAELFTPSKHEQ